MGNEQRKVGVFNDVGELCGFVSRIDQDGYRTQFGNSKQAFKVKRAVGH